jgi:type IV fimbrial biogenesis protein FimT
MRRIGGFNGGFTLIEALIVLAAASLLLCVAVPSWRSASASTHTAAAKATLVETWLDAVNHAALTGVEVVACPGAPTECRPGVDWSGGWIAFADLDGDRQHGPGETLLVRGEALQGGVKLRSTPGRTRLVFQPNGGNAGSNVTFTLCDSRGPDQASAVVLSNQGRLRSAAASRKAAEDCAYAP